jgi:hypothetical protein
MIPRKGYEKEEKEMEKNIYYTDCERRLIQKEGFNLSQAAEICANGESRLSDEKKMKSKSLEGGEEYEGLE